MSGGVGGFFLDLAIPSSNQPPSLFSATSIKYCKTFLYCTTVQKLPISKKWTGNSHPEEKYEILLLLMNIKLLPLPANSNYEHVTSCTLRGFKAENFETYQYSGKIFPPTLENKKKKVLTRAHLRPCETFKGCLYKREGGLYGVVLLCLEGGWKA